MLMVLFYSAIFSSTVAIDSSYLPIVWNFSFGGDGTTLYVDIVPAYMSYLPTVVFLTSPGRLVFVHHEINVRILEFCSLTTLYK